MKLSRQLFLFAVWLMPFAIIAQPHHEKVDTTIVAKIRDEGFSRSQVMDILQMLTDVNGSRLSFSPGYKSAAAYAKKALEGWGMANVQFDTWGDVGKGWSIKKYHMHMLEPTYYPLVGYPKAWSPAVKGTVTGEVIYLNATTEDDLKKYKGKLKGKVVMMDLPPKISFAFEPGATRFNDSTLLQWANDVRSDRGFRFPTGAPENITYQKWKLCIEEGALAVISHGAGRGDNGALTVSGAYFPIPPETPRGERPRAFSPNAPATLPQVSMLSEHYNRIFRTLEKGIKVKIELTLDVAFTTPEEGYNVVAEIPGTDLKDEVVMIGAHLDSWHSATGTTDNGAGSAVMLEAMRIMKSLGIQPRRTIRIGLWGGEEQGLLGSRGYVKKHLGERVGEETKFKPAAEKFSVYFNMDNGTGKFRGIYMQGNEGVRDIFREWFRPFNDLDAATLATFNTGGTDHLAFDGIGLPGFQFIQDPIEYRTRTHHTSLDGFDKAIPDDLKQNAVIVATFAWLAANRDELMPRK